MEKKLVLLALAFCTFLASLLLVRVFCRYAGVYGLLDVPNARSSHDSVTPRGGGIVFVLLWLVVMSYAYKKGVLTLNDWKLFVPTTLVVSLLGFWDDRRTLSAQIRLCVQIIVALLCIYLLGGIPGLRLYSPFPFDLGWFGMAVGILGIVWSINLYNFMDGIDGIASIEALFVFGVGGLMFWLSRHPGMALVPWAMGFGVAGFLVWNWPKARVFMGDVGSYCLGFLVALVSLIGDLWYRIPMGLWIILYSVFWFDATVTLVRRIILKKHWATAHRDHAYVRLYDAGISQTKILLGMIVLNTGLAALTLWTFYHQHRMKYSLLLTVGVLTAIYLWVERIKPLTKE